VSKGINSRLLEDLHPTLNRGARELMRRMAQAGFPHVGISSTYRNNAHQEYLFAQGRTRPGAIITNARGGQSVHNYRLAFDIFQNIRGKEWNNPRFFETAGRLWREMGGVWGGDWIGFVDRVHMQFTGELLLRDLQNGRRLPDNARMLWEMDEDIYMKEEAEDVMRFHDVSEVPEWAVHVVTKLIERRYLNGDDEGRLNLSEDMLRLLVVNYRAGLYG